MWNPRLHGVGFWEMLTEDYRPPPRPHPAVILFFLAIVAILAATGVICCKRSRLGQTLDAVSHAANEADRRNQEIKNLAKP